MNETELIDQYIDALRRDPHAAPPPGLDADTAAFVRALVEAQHAKSPSRDMQARMWHRSLLLADPQRQPPLDQKSSRRGHIEQNVTIVKPSTRKNDREDDDMNNLSVRLPLARIAPRTGPPTPRYFLQYTITIAAAVALIVLVGAVLIDMISDPINGWPALIDVTEEPTIPELAVITPENVDQLEQIGFLGRGTITDMAWSPDGKTLALSSVPSGIIWLYDAENLDAEPRWLPGHPEGTLKVSFNADGTTLASVGLDNYVRLWDVRSGEVIGVFDQHRVSTLAFSADGKWLAGSGITLNTSWVWDAATGEEKALLKGDSRPFSLDFSPDGRLLISGNIDGKVQVWEVAGSTLLATLEGHEDRVNRVIFSPLGDMFASGSRDGGLRLWNWNGTTGALDVALRGDDKSVDKLNFSPDGKTLASADSAGNIRLWDTETGVERVSLTGHTDRIIGIAFSPDGVTLASMGIDETLRLWNVTNATQEQQINVPFGLKSAPTGFEQTFLIFSPDGQMIGTTGLGGGVYVWDAKTHQQIAAMEASGGAWSLAFSPDNTLLAAGGHTGSIYVWNLETGAEEAVLEVGPLVGSVVFSPDGRTLVSGGDDIPIHLWDVATWEKRADLEGHTNSTTNLAFNSDGSLLASASYDKTVRIWDMATGDTVRVLEGHTDLALGAQFSPDGTLLATSSLDGTVRLWDVATGEPRFIIDDYKDGAPNIRFSPDGKILSIGVGAWNPGDKVEDIITQFWDVEAVKPLHVLNPPVGAFSILFSPDGRLIATGHVDGTVRLWGVPNNP